eukprot:COSAG01_NODE_8568_length_2737_cov_4.139121_1_plen_394_part_00
MLTMLMMVVLVIVPTAAALVLGNVDDLHRQHRIIFPSGNRNAAAHKWASFLLQHSASLPIDRLVQLAAGYCAVSGAVLHPHPGTRYRMRLQRVDGSGTVTGFMYYCCWPCVCDTQDFIRVDSTTLRTADGVHRVDVAVIGDPCDHAQELSKSWVHHRRGATTLLESASEVHCDKHGRLAGANYSEHGYPILSLFFPTTEVQNHSDSPSTHTPGHPPAFQDEREFATMCQQRREQGFNSGMGEIFRRVAAVRPVKLGERGAFRSPKSMGGDAAALRQELQRRLKLVGHTDSIMWAVEEAKGVGVTIGAQEEGTDATNGTDRRQRLIRLLEATQADALRHVVGGFAALREVTRRRRVLVSDQASSEEYIAALVSAMTLRKCSTERCGAAPRRTCV